MSLTQSLGCIEYAEKTVGRYREDVEEWKREHDELANDCWIWESFIALANVTSDRISSLKGRIQTITAGCTIEKASVVHARYRHVLRVFLDVLVFVRVEADRLEVKYGPVAGAEALRTNIATISEEIKSPRPVTFGEDGRIFEENGEQFFMPGLAPEDVTRGLEDDRAGRVRSLRERVAARQLNGI